MYQKPSSYVSFPVFYKAFERKPFEPDAPNIEDWRDAYGSDLRKMPELGLYLAVLEDAAGIYQRRVTATSGAGVKEFQEAERWILACDDGDSYPFTFLNVCGVLGLNPEIIRSGLIRWGQMAREGKITYKKKRGRVSGDRHRVKLRERRPKRV